MIEVCSLSSGSNGNAFFVKTGTDCFLVDAGISCKQICLRLQQIRSHIDEIKAIFITHEHSDHTRGLRVLLNKFPVPVYITEKTYSNSDLFIDEEYLNFISSNDRVAINGTEIQSLPKSTMRQTPVFLSFFIKVRKSAL